MFKSAYADCIGKREPLLHDSLKLSILYFNYLILVC